MPDLDVDLDRGPVQVDAVGDDLGRVAVAVVLEADPGVVARELLGPIVDAGLADALGDRIDDPAVEGRERVAERSEAVGHHHRVVAADVDDDRAVVGVVGVQRVEHEARVDVAPDDLVGRAVAGEESDPCRSIVLPTEREAAAGHDRVEIDGDREVVDDGVGGGQRHVVDHRHVRHGDVDDLASRSPLEPTTTYCTWSTRSGQWYDHRMEFAGGRVVLRVGGERAGQRVAEAVDAERVEFVGQLDGRRPASTIAHVVPANPPTLVFGPPWPPGMTYRLRYHSALPPRRRTPWTMPSPTNQCAAAASGAGRVRPVAEPATLELGGDLAGHREVERRDLVFDRRHVAGEVPVVVRAGMAIGVVGGAARAGSMRSVMATTQHDK